ncbi:MAG: two component transcriptional regulator, winged helix family [Bacillales bacterium]|jgi:DNA-binding response OmpR family regulator|nr:two component transcriptional regulator, winged helix family [Bacillales bacterium]
MEQKHNVLVVDDEPKILEIVKAYLESNNFQVFTAETGKDALKILNQENISLMLLDLMLPDITGEEICKQVREKSNLPIIMMTAKSDEDSIIQGLNIGADDYITKPFSPRQLVARVVAILRRTKIELDQSAGNASELTVDTENRIVSKNGKILTLTPNEYKILVLLIGRPQKIFTRDEIIQSVMNGDFDGFDRTVDTHVKNLRHKIEDDPKSPKYILTVYGLGYRFGGSE